MPRNLEVKTNLTFSHIFLYFTISRHTDVLKSSEDLRNLNMTNELC